ncbi:MAG: C_GCAxxG_C_C family protein [Spirochaetes bacterium]|nr:C_GCAxxG_C_C family protein [Spirochaetota bacterium]
MNRKQIASEKFTSGYNCAQSVLYAFCDHFNLDKDTALKIACGFGAGMGRTQSNCGAVVGGIMVLNLIYGRGENDDREVMMDNYEKVRELLELFKKKFSTYNCRGLLSNCDLMTEEGQKYYQENDLRNKVCTSCVETVIELIEKNFL